MVDSHHATTIESESAIRRFRLRTFLTEVCREPLRALCSGHEPPGLRRGGARVFESRTAAAVSGKLSETRHHVRESLRRQRLAQPEACMADQPSRAVQDYLKAIHGLGGA